MDTADGEQPAKRQRTSHADRLVAIGSQLKCPITGELLVDPVFTVDGQIYEREPIQRSGGLWGTTRRQQQAGAGLS